MAREARRRREDDDKFADCAIAAEAEWIVTEDAHFDVLKNSGHKPQPITPEAFIRNVLGKAWRSGSAPGGGPATPPTAAPQPRSWSLRLRSDSKPDRPAWRDRGCQ